MVPNKAQFSPTCFVNELKKRLDTCTTTAIVSSPRKEKKSDTEVPCLPTEITEAAISARFRKNVYLWKADEVRADTVRVAVDAGLQRKLTFARQSYYNCSPSDVLVKRTGDESKVYLLSKTINLRVSRRRV